MQKENPQIEKFTADAILQKGVAIPLPAPFLIRLFKKTVNLTLKLPYEGTMHRVASYYLSTGLTLEKLDSLTVEDALLVHAKHGKTISKALAVAVLNGYWKGKLFTKFLAWYLRWHLASKDMFDLVTVLVVHGGTQDFIITTKLVRQMKLTTPNLGQNTKGS